MNGKYLFTGRNKWPFSATSSLYSTVHMWWHPWHQSCQVVFTSHKVVQSTITFLHTSLECSLWSHSWICDPFHTVLCRCCTSHPLVCTCTIQTSTKWKLFCTVLCRSCASHLPICTFTIQMSTKWELFCTVLGKNGGNWLWSYLRCPNYLCS